MKTLSVCVAVCLLIPACGVESGGEWSPGEVTEVKPNSPTQVSHYGPWVSPSSPSTTPTPVADRFGFIVCEIPPAHVIDLAGGTEAPYYIENRSSVCLGEVGSPAAPSLCWEVKAFEDHARAVAECFVAARQELNRQGGAIMGREWWPLAKPMLPSIWLKPTSEVVQLSGLISSGFVHLINGGEEAEAPGTPLCFDKPDGKTAAQAKDQAIRDIGNIVDTTREEIDEIYVALKKGINVKVNLDLNLTLTVAVVERHPNIEDAPTCTFRANHNVD